MTTSTARAATASSSRKGVSNVHLSSSSKVGGEGRGGRGGKRREGRDKEGKGREEREGDGGERGRDSMLNSSTVGNVHSSPSLMLLQGITTACVSIIGSSN